MRLYNPVHILVGTPGRIHDLADKKIADISKCATIIMDEADKFLSPEFQPVLESLIMKCSTDRQICLFSATFPVTVRGFKDKFLPRAQIINLMDELTLRMPAPTLMPYQISNHPSTNPNQLERFASFVLAMKSPYTIAINLLVASVAHMSRQVTITVMTYLEMYFFGRKI